jgi:hypothetical protein
LERVLRDPDAGKAMGAKARALVGERYAVDAATAAYADIYDELVELDPR